MKKLILVAILLSLTVTAKAESINLPEVINKIPGINQSYVIILDDDHDQAHLTSVTLAKWKTINFDIGFLSEDGLAFAVSTDLIETPQLKYPILKYIQLKPIIGYSFDRLFSGKSDEKGNGIGFVDSERIFAGVQIVSIKF